MLGHFLPQLCEFYNQKYNASLRVEHFHSYNFWECGMGASREETTLICYEFFASDLFKTIPPIAGARESLEQIKAECNVDLVIVTSRQIDIQAATSVWLDQHYPGLFSSLRFRSCWENVESFG